MQNYVATSYDENTLNLYLGDGCDGRRSLVLLTLGFRIWIKINWILVNTLNLNVNAILLIVNWFT